MRIILFFSILLLGELSVQRTGFYGNSALKKNKLNHYFKQTNTNYNVVYNRKQFIVDSLNQIKQNSAKIDFVEVSEFTDSLSVRWITASNTSHNNFLKFNAKKSTHLGTTYISIPKDYKYVNNDLRKVISVIESNLVNKSSLKLKDVIGDYLAEDVKGFDLFYINGSVAGNAIITNLGNSIYEFDVHQPDDESLFIAEYLLKYYSFEKFQKLWMNGFSDFEEVYGVSFEKANLERKELALRIPKHKSSVNWEDFNKCI